MMRIFAYIVFFFSLLSFALPPLSGEELYFRFNLQKDDLFIIEKYQDVQIQNFRVKEKREEKNRIVLKVLEKTPEYVRVAGYFYIYKRLPSYVGGFRFDKEFLSSFRIYNNGRYLVEDQYIMPNVRSIPTFPDKAVRLDEKWVAKASLLLIFQNYLIPMEFPVSYSYRGKKVLPREAYLLLQKNKSEFPMIHSHLQFKHPIQNRKSPVKLIESVEDKIIFLDEKRGIPVYDYGKSQYLFHLSKIDKILYDYTIYTWYNKVPSIRGKKDQIVNKLNKELDKQPGIKVEKHRQGVRISLDAILFAHDSANLTDKAKETVKKIASSLQQYPHREIRIFGHTDNIGDKQYNRQLSEQRAIAVWKELIHHNINKSRLSYRGFGESSPLASNETKEGRAKNRRVEIYLITE